MRLQPGDRIGHYEILAPLGAGGMGEVFRARDARLGRTVAIKALRKEAIADRERLRRFFAEAKTIASLNHPNVVTLYDLHEDESGPCIVTELVEGRTLRELIADGPMDGEAALRIGVQLADGLAKAHEAGVLHRDVKPENVMVTAGGLVKILDFGLAKLLAADETVVGLAAAEPAVTQTGMIVGTPAYLSPEQLRGRPADTRSDVFAVGLVLYELLAGANPFRRDSAIETMHAILQVTPEPVDAAFGAPPELSAIIRRATDKDPAKRFADAREMAASLRTVRVDPGALARPAARRRPPVLVWSAGAIVVVLLALAWRDLVKTQHAEIPTPPVPAALPPPPGLVTASMAMVPAGKTGMVILPIVDETGDAELSRADVGRVLADAFVQILKDLPGFYLIDRHRLESVAMSLGGTLEGAARDGSFARDLAMKVTAGAVLSGRLTLLGGVYVLHATLTEIPSDIVLDSFQAQSERPATLLAELTGRVSNEMRSKYAAATTTRDVEHVATKSLEAYAHFVRGDDLIHEGDWQSAIPELRDAVRIDPEMALGWSSLSCALYWGGEEAEAKVAHQQAMQFVDRLNEMERAWVELDGVWVTTQNGDLYLEAMQRHLEKYPDDYQGYFYAGLACQWLNGDCASAIPWFEKAYQVLPGWYPVTKSRVDCLVELGRTADARSALNKYLALPSLKEHGRTQAALRLQEIERS
jgi:tRNA A-37 threonylcarbamoyl transferase component Bud32/Flp pilus assembly protein TadD